MKLRDFDLLARKILVGVAITAVPAAILIAGLWGTQHVLTRLAAGSTVQQKGRP